MDRIQKTSVVSWKVPQILKKCATTPHPSCFSQSYGYTSLSLRYKKCMILRSPNFKEIQNVLTLTMKNENQRVERRKKCQNGGRLWYLGKQDSSLFLLGGSFVVFFWWLFSIWEKTNLFKYYKLCKPLQRDWKLSKIAN